MKIKISKNIFVFVLAVLIALITNFFVSFAIINDGNSFHIFLVLKFYNKKNSKVIVRNPFSGKFEIKKLIAEAGDTVLLRNGIAYVNGEPEKDTMSLNFLFYWQYVNIFYKKSKFLRLKKLSAGQSEKWVRSGLKAAKFVVSAGWNNPEIYPFTYKYRWNEYFFGPLVIPQKGREVSDLYKFTSEFFNEQIIFSKDYVFVLNFDRSETNDSRTWGPIPRSAVIGKIIKIF